MNLLLENAQTEYTILDKLKLLKINKLPKE